MSETASKPLPQVHASSWRLLYAMDILNWWHLGRIRLENAHHLEAFDPNQPTIIACTHLGDLDMSAAIGTLGRYRDLVVANASNQHSLRQKTGINLGMRLAGSDHFLPVDYKKRRSQTSAHGVFNPDNYEAMKRAIVQGKTLIIAAHNPIIGPARLPKGGYGAVYVYEITPQAVIMPVTVDVEGLVSIDSDGLPVIGPRPNARIIVHPPLMLDRLSGIDRLTLLARKRSQERPLTEEEIRELHTLTHHLQQQSDLVMRVLASALPTEKRGAYAA